MSYETREILNQPFEFEEVLIDHRTRHAILRSAKIEGAFATTGPPNTQTPLPTRKLAVRLRTINNACEAPFRMHDGRPVTEVSMYGSRDRQYLVGPYWGVHRLMRGSLPWQERRELHDLLSNTCGYLTEQLGHVDAFLRDPEGKATSVQVAAAYRENLESKRESYKRFPINPVEPDRVLETTRRHIRLTLGIDLVTERVGAIRDYSVFLAETIAELTQLNSQIKAADWYWGWSTGKEEMEQRIRELGEAYATRRDALRGQDWPDRRHWGRMRTLGNSRPICDGFDG